MIRSPKQLDYSQNLTLFQLTGMLRDSVIFACIHVFCDCLFLLSATPSPTPPPPTPQRLQQCVKHLEEVVASSERSFTKLEQDLVQVTKVSLYVQHCPLIKFACMYVDIVDYFKNR